MAENQKERVPLFPLGVVPVPGAMFPLHIFEERYRELLADCFEGIEPPGKPFGVVLSTEQGVSELACLVRIDQILRRYEDGRSDILTFATERFRVLEKLNERSYTTAEVELLEDHNPAGNPHLEREVWEKASSLMQEFTGEQLPPKKKGVQEKLSFHILRYLDFGPGAALTMLGMLSENERLEYLSALIVQMQDWRSGNLQMVVDSELEQKVH